ncbi:MAG: tetratricopeptide repeat protein [Planctomycetes bacterium]|nr:tetratricopeptide repeat protein [Planctomycetota bacterium]
MSTQTRSRSHEQAICLAEAGNYQEAFDLIETHLQHSPQDSEAINDAGVILHCLGRSADAVEYLQRARGLDGNYPEITWNLVEAYLAEARADEAKALLGEMERSETIHIEILNRAADIFINENKLADALEMLEWSLRLQPNQEILEPICVVVRHKLNDQLAAS